MGSLVEADERVRAEVVELLRDGPLSYDQLLAALTELDLVPDDSDLALHAWLEHIVLDQRFMPTSDLVGHATSLLDGIVVCHRVTASELRRGAVSVERNLGALDWAGSDEVLTMAGKPCTYQGADLSGPDGWLDGVEAGEIIAFHRDGTELLVERAPALTDGQREAEALAAAARRLRADQGVELLPMMAMAIVADPSLFRSPVPPATELLRSQGMERRWRYWGFRNETWRPRHVRDDDPAAALELGMAAFEDGACRDLEFIAASASNALDELLWVAGAHEPSTVEALLATASLSEDARCILEASLAERSGDPTRARSMLSTVWEATSLSSVGVRLADYALWAGEFELAASLFATTGRSSRAELCRGVHDELEAATRRASRNGPCPCGSSRKFKHCCLRTGAIIGGDATRVALVCMKLALAARCRFLGIESNHRIVEHARTCDLRLERAPLLPAVERSIFDEVLVEPIRLWELVEMRDGVALLQSGDRLVEVRGVSGPPHSWGLARVLPDRRMVFGDVEPIDRHQARSISNMLPPDAESAQLLAALGKLGDNDAGYQPQERSR